jgi:hypothetical protein
MRKMNAKRAMMAAIFSVCAVSAMANAQEEKRQITDEKAVYLDAPEFKIKGDGVADDTEALQAAINKVQETTKHGILFVTPGKYRISKTIHVWGGIRLIGITKDGKRPEFILGDKTPGFQEVVKDEKGFEVPGYMFKFVSGRPAEGQPIRDGNPGTFYSAISDVDFRIGEGNPAAVGIRFNVAQHCFITRIDFHIGSGRAGIDGTGNEAEDVKFFGGQYGIVTHSTSPSWPFLLIDAKFEGQRACGIRTDWNTMTIVRASFKKMPSAVVIKEKQWEGLWMKDCRMEEISGPGIVIGDDATERTKVNIEDLACVKVPMFAELIPSGKKLSGFGDGDLYNVADFMHGIKIPAPGDDGFMYTACECEFEALEAPPKMVSDIPALPPRELWVNVKTLGVKGDGATDDTAALKEAIAKNKVLYLPMGRYKVTDTIALRSDTVLIGLHPAMTQIVLPDNTPAFSGEGAWKALVETPKDGASIFTGIGIETGVNSRAVGAKWLAGEKSYMNDVKFFGGHGGVGPDGSRMPAYNRERTGDADPNRKWDTQPYSLWITDGGGGVFKDVWSANPMAKAGICIENTKTPGRIYATSVEHHVTTEVKIKNVENWYFTALQTEEERLESPKAIAVDIEDSKNLTFANLCLFRMSTEPGKFAVRVRDSSDINFRGVRNYSPQGTTTFQNTLYETKYDKYVVTKDFAWLKVGG